MAAGDFVVRRNNANTDALPDTDGGTLDTIWDTSVDSEGTGITGGDSGASGVFTLGETGRFLVAFSDQFGTTDTTNNERTTSDLQVVLAGTLLREGGGSGFVRRSGGSQEAVPSGICYVNVSTTTGNGDELILRHTRRDNSTAGTVNRIADMSQISILKLDDSWNFAHYRSSAAYTPSATDNTRNQSNIGSTVEQDGTVFSRSGNVVTVTTANPVLVMWTHQVDYTDALSGRTEMQGSIDFDTAELVRGVSQVYGPRGSDNANAATFTSATIVYPDDTGQALELNLISREDADEDWFTELQLIELPSGVETATVQRTTAAGSFNYPTSNASASFLWETTINVDTAAFTYSAGNANIDVDNADDYWFVANVGNFSDGGVSGARAVPAQRIRINSADLTYFGCSSYNRQQQTADHAHMFFGGLIPALSANDSVIVRSDRIGTATTAMPGVGGFSLVRLSSLFATGDAIATPATLNVVAAVPASTQSASVEHSQATTNTIGDVPAATATGGSLTAPATVDAPGGIPSTTVSASVEHSQTTVGVPAGVPASTVSASVEHSQTTTNAPVAVPSASITASVEQDTATLAALGAIPAATVLADSAVTPGTLDAPGAIPAVTITASVEHAQATTDAPATIPGPTVTASVEHIQATLNAPAAIPTPTLLADATPTPGSLDALGNIPQADAFAGVTALPATVDAPAAVPSVTTTASVEHAQATTNVVAAAPSATVTASVELSVSSLNATGLIPAATITASVEKALAAVAAVAGVPAVTLTASVEKTLATLNAVGAIPGPTASASVEHAQATVDVVAAIPLPTVTGGGVSGDATATPATVNVVVTIPALGLIATITHTGFAFDHGTEAATHGGSKTVTQSGAKEATHRGTGTPTKSGNTGRPW